MVTMERARLFHPCYVYFSTPHLLWSGGGGGMYLNQCFGSGSGMDPESIRSEDPDSVSGSGSRRAKMNHKNIKKLRNFMFWSAECSLLWDECFSCSLDVLYGGLGIRKLQFFIKNISHFFSCKFCFHFWSSKPGSGSAFSLKCWIRNQWIRILNTAF